VGRRVDQAVAKHLAASETIARELRRDGVLAEKGAENGSVKDADKIAIVPRGVEPLPAELEITREQAFAELELPPTARAVAIVARLKPSKNVKELIWHADLVRVLDDDLRVVIFGDGPIRPELERFARMASDLEHIRFAGERHDVRSLLPHFEMLWHAGGESAPPVAVLEAMAAGVPVVADLSPGACEAIVDGETGCLVPAGGRAERGRVTKQLFDDETLRRAMGDAARRCVAERFGVEPMVSGTIAAYESVLPEAAPV
ncbi:MAG: glycosyltransferase, partial [Planctomycetota bacterium]